MEQPMNSAKNDKLKLYRDNLTPEQKQEALARAVQARADKAAERKSNEHLYTLKYMDERYWKELAQNESFHMPIYNQPCTTTIMRRVLKKLKVDTQFWMACVGINTLQQWISLNPTHTAYAFAGNILEYKQEASL